VPIFENTAFTNANADALTFEDENDQPAQYKTGELPDPKLLFSPRFGFNVGSQHAGPRRYRYLHGPARLRLDFEPDW
jgi:hypothetical protein